MPPQEPDQETDIVEVGPPPDVEQAERDQRTKAQPRTEFALIDAARMQAQHRSAPAMRGATPGGSIPGYRILRELHRGGQGVVYLAIQEGTRRKVAIKVMREGPFSGSTDRVRFEREVQVLAQLNNPNIVAIHDSGAFAGSYYYVMDYIAGQTLDEYVRLHEPSIRDILKLFVQICGAVNAAHLRGVIHRDLKPSNIRVTPAGTPHVLDFGLAKVSDGASPGETMPTHMTATGQFIGSMPWSSPEQAQGDTARIDVRSDVYSLGVILYQLICGRFPYKIEGLMTEVMQQITSAEPVRPRSISKKIDGEVETIILKPLAKLREHRYQTAGEFARDIERYLAGEPIEAKRDNVRYMVKKLIVRYRVRAAVIGVVLLSIIGLAAAMAVLYTRELDRGNEVAAERARADLAEQRLRSAEQTIADLRAELDALKSPQD